MTYLGYVVAAYAVFVALLVVDAIGSRLRLRRALRDAGQRQQRADARRRAATQPPSLELER